MRLELPDGYKHVALLMSDARITGCHIVEDDRPALPNGATAEERRARGRLVRSLCDEPIDTRQPEGGGLAPYGTVAPDSPGTPGWLTWPCTCSSCALELARRVLHIPYDGMGMQLEVFDQYWDKCGRIDVKANA